MVQEDLFALEEQDPGWVSVSGMQCGLRSLFASKPLHRASAEALQEFGALFEADYVVMHACFGATPLSEEWSREDFALSEALRQQANEALAKTSENDEPRCVRLGGSSGSVAIMAAVLHGDNAEQAGCIGMLFRDCTRAHAYEVMVQFEALAGFLSLLLAEGSAGQSGRTQARDISEASGQPLRLMLELVAELNTRHKLDQIAVGVVDGHRVEVALANDACDLRPSNPGVKRIRDAMLECLDADDVICVSGASDEPQYRFHEVWRKARGEGVVASIPLLAEDRIVAIVSLGADQPEYLTEEVISTVQADLARYASLLPAARLATRSWSRHSRDMLTGCWQRLRSRRRRMAAVAALLVAAIGWLTFGSMTYQLTVPCVVKAMDRRVVSSPRGGVLSEMYVRPGDQVDRGQLLAELDSHDDVLTRAELEAETMSIEAQIDLALGEGDSGKLRVLEAQRNGVLAKISVVAQRIEQARIRSPIDGVVLMGELRERLGARLAMGESLFELARYDGAMVEMHVPEQVVLAAKESRSVTFVAAAAPDVEHLLEGFRLAPASTVVNGNNVFVGEATLAEFNGWVPPGMEGYAMIDAGPRSAAWVLTHQVLDWMRFNFWL